MIPHTRYEILKYIKIHTNPLRTACVRQVGYYLGETKSYYIFEHFRIRKSMPFQFYKYEG